MIRISRVANKKEAIPKGVASFLLVTRWRFVCIFAFIKAKI